MTTAVIESIATSAQAQVPATASAPATMGHVNEYLTFRLGTEEYGIDILRVQEIRSYEAPSSIANAPGFILGVINLRGVIVQIIDMRLRFNLSETSYGDSTVTIVLNLGSQVVGMVVDSVSDVVTLTSEQMRHVPEFSTVVDAKHIHAIGAVDERMLILIDIVALMSSSDMALQS